MFRSVLLIAMAMSFSAVAYADEPTAEKTSLKVYPVGNLVSVGAMNGSMAGRTTSNEWVSEYSATITALDELQNFVETMCERKPLAVRTYAPTLSLIVRHTQDGHDEIAQLLRTLAEDNDSSIRMECRPLYEGSPSKLFKEQEAAERQRLELLLTKTRLSKSESTELLSFLPSLRSRTEYAQFDETVVLKPGRRTPWGPGFGGRIMTAMGRVDLVKKTVQVRIDYMLDNLADATPFGSQVLSLAEGESTLFYQYNGGSALVWLVTAEILTQEQTSSLDSAASR